MVIHFDNAKVARGAELEPISMGLLAALAGGAGGELGRQAWAGLSALVRPLPIAHAQRLNL
jgi:hypothetical protein